MSSVLKKADKLNIALSLSLKYRQAVMIALDLDQCRRLTLISSES